MSTNRTLTIFGSIAERDHFDLVVDAIRTAADLSDPASYLIYSAIEGKPFTLNGKSYQCMQTIMEVSKKVGLRFHITELDWDNVPLRRLCWRPDAATPFVVELTPDEEPAFTTKQLNDAIQVAGTERAVETLCRWADHNIPTLLTIEPSIIEELRQERAPGR
jgi:hypothetical protein